MLEIKKKKKKKDFLKRGRGREKKWTEKAALWFLYWVLFPK